MLKSKFFTIGMILMVLVLLEAFIRTRQPIASLNAEINHLNQKVTEAQQKNEDLSKQASYSLNDSYVERQLRLKFNYKKADEEAVLIYKTEPTGPKPEEPGFLSQEYKKFSEWLKSIFD